MGVDLDGDGTIDDAFGVMMAAVRQNNPDLGDLDAQATARLADHTWLVGAASCDDGTTRISLGQSGGRDEAPVSLLADPIGTFVPVMWVRADHASGMVAAGPDAIDGAIGFAIPMPDAVDPLLAPYAAYLTAQLQGGTSPFAELVDTDGDGTVTVAELLANQVIAPFVKPDLDGGLSVGLVIHGHRVAL